MGINGYRGLLENQQGVLNANREIMINQLNTRRGEMKLGERIRQWLVTHESRIDFQRRALSQDVLGRPGKNGKSFTDC